VPLPTNYLAPYSIPVVISSQFSIDVLVKFAFMGTVGRSEEECRTSAGSLEEF
jgi:hypothetical protein